MAKRQRIQIIRKNTLETLALDAVPSMGKQTNIDVFTKPIQNGKDVIEHVNKGLDQLNLESIQSAKTIGTFVSDIDVPNKLGKTDDFFDRAVGKELRVVTQTLGIFDPVVLSGYTPDVGTQEQLNMSLSFREGRFSTSETVEIPAEQVQDLGLASTESVGQQSKRQATGEERPTSDADDAEGDVEESQRKSDEEVANAQGKSLLASGTDTAASLF